MFLFSPQPLGPTEHWKPIGSYSNSACYLIFFIFLNAIYISDVFIEKTFPLFALVLPDRIWDSCAVVPLCSAEQTYT